MAAAMVVPAVPLICVRLLDVISGPICGAHCAATIVAMVAVMLYRPATMERRTRLPSLHLDAPDARSMTWGCR
jgi:hypothetical protein